MSRRIDAILMTILVGDVVVPLFRPSGDRQGADGRLVCHRAGEDYGESMMTDGC